MSFLKKLELLEEKEVLVKVDNLQFRKAYQVLRLDHGRSNFDNSKWSIKASLYLAPKVTGIYYLPSRYANHPNLQKRISESDCAAINADIASGKKFYVVKKGVYAGNPDVDFVPSTESNPITFPLYDGTN